MADDADTASEIERAHRERALAEVRREPFEAWVAGKCEECGDETPRLVEGKCAPCREPWPPLPRRY